MHTSNDTCISRQFLLADEAATLALGQALAQVLHGGLVIELEGDLGAGKTTLSRGILRGAGHTGRVKSPTYTLVEPYVVSNLYFYHFDLYRFNDPSEWEDAGFRDHFNRDSVCLIEWADKAAGLLPQPDWRICLRPDGDGRHAELHAYTSQGKACASKILFPGP